jgi:hypothetical protein
MPTKYRVKVAGSAAGSYTQPVTALLLTQSSSGAADFSTPILYVPPFVGGLVPGYATEGDPYSATAEYGNVRSVYLVPNTVITGVGSAGAGATAYLYLYRAGSLIGTIASLAFDSGVNAGAIDGRSLGTISTTYQTIRFGDVLEFRWLQGGTGLALPASRLVVDIV